jgi:cytochrome b6-f complex iron-sulfur subunit
MAGEAAKSRPRRRFLDVALCGSAAAFSAAMGYPVARFAEPEARATAGPAIVGRLEDFPVGTAKTVLAHERPVLVLRAADGTFRALSAICTHLQCVVAWSAERKQIECPCHGGVYSSEGEHIAGPPPRRLAEFAVTVSEGSVIVSAPA